MLNILSYIGISLQAEVCLWTLLGLLRTIFDATLFKVNANLKQEERPTLVLPWLLLAAVRKFLCELTSLALGLGTCVLLGPARPPCVRFLITKIISITPAFYMWLIVLRYAERQSIIKPHVPTRLKFDETAYVVPSDNSVADIKNEADVLRPMSVTSNRTMSDTGTFEEWINNELVIPRDTDRILEQFVTMSLGIVAYLKKEGTDSSKFFDSLSTKAERNLMNLDCNALSSENTDPPPLVGSSKGKLASYLTDYPQIFMKKASDILQRKSESNEFEDKETENKNTDNRDSFFHSYDETVLSREKSSFNEINNIKGSGESSYVSQNNSNILQTDSSGHKNQEKNNEKLEFNITMTPESNVSFQDIIYEIISRLSSNSVPKSENRTEPNVELRNTSQSQSTSKSSSSASFK
ncbi:unnamed protein product [Parnassius apollo]|uniref:(apollo) hypothetical protein n=1 Tax=Parnassius apollo TaxID=110799 RepID=A0A8S3XKY2_PARAO|nr:unnamed protein product [Parnassius apollo]